MEKTTLDSVSEYYGKVLKTSKDLQTNACCTAATPPPYLQAIMSNINDDVTSKYYGCGLVAPELLEGKRVLDLGCGSGRDCYVLSQLVGPSGFVVGVDMTEEQLEVANRNVDWHMKKFGYSTPNIEFKLGFIEKLGELGFAADSFDVIISNCVVNLSPNKEAVLSQAYHLLKPGGEMYFSDVYSNKRVPQSLREDPTLWGECLSGALYWIDFIRLANAVGFIDPRVVTESKIEISNREIEEKVGHISFHSVTCRLWKIAALETLCEDYGQVAAVVYLGTIPHHPHQFQLDSHHLLLTGKIFPVCGNTYRMLHDTRYTAHFQYIGNWNTHYGLFEGCGTSLPFSSTSSSNAKTSSCC